MLVGDCPFTARARKEEVRELNEQKFPGGTKRPFMPYCFALCYEGKGETGKAIEILEKALEEDPNIRSADSCRRKLQQLREGGNN